MQPSREEVWEAQQEVQRLRALLIAAVARRDALVKARYPSSVQTVVS